VETAHYRIRVRGLLSDRFEEVFDPMSLEPGDGETAIVGDVRDQSQLYGILDRIHNLGLELISVNHGKDERGLGGRRWQRTTT